MERKQSEHTEQVSLFDWCHANKSRHPQLDLIFAIPNGGLRNKAVGKKLKMEGVKAGVPDIFLAVPKGEKHGLFIELKYGTNKPTQTQLDWLQKLRAEGYEAQVCWGFEQARDCINNYLGLETQ
tara:strand:+ start:223 stop:594 length:372 start_codon:yes stop_codon:yes gene_type:complete